MSDAPENTSVRINIKDTLDFCRRHGIDFDAVLRSIRDEGWLISMGQKYRTRNGQGVTILTVSAPNTAYPVIGYYNEDGAPAAWTPSGEKYVGGESWGDLEPEEVIAATEGEKAMSVQKDLQGLGAANIKAVRIGREAALDEAWAAINAQGGHPDNSGGTDFAYDEAIGHAINIIEKLGGMDPAKRGKE